MEEKEKVEMQNKLILKLIGKIRENSFNDLKMEDIAKLMGISRATLYKYFSNKEEIFLKFTDGLVDYIESMENPYTSDKSVHETFQEIFEQSVSLALLIPEKFMQELNNTFPEMYHKLSNAINIRNDQVLTFYEKGIEMGLFQQINGQLILLQNNMLNTLLNLKYLMTHQLTIEKALWDFYELQKFQLFQVEERLKVKDSLMEPKISYLVRKIISILN